MLAGGSVPGTGATLMMPLRETAYGEFKVILSGNGDYGYVSASGTIPIGTLTASIPMEGITGAISASADQWFNLSNAVPLTARKDGGTVVTGVGELAWKSAVDSVTNTVAVNSADWGQGGMSPVTVSSIASSYANSAASSKLDTTAFGTVSGTFLTAHQDLSDYQTVAGMTAYQPVGNYMAADALTGLSGTWETVTGKLDTTAQVVTATGSGKVSGTGISSLNGSSIIANSLSDAGRIMIGSGDAGMYLTGGSNGGTAYYKSNEMVINRSGYGEQVKFNLGSAGSQVYGSASGQRGAFIQMNNDYHRAFLGALSGKDVIIELDGYSANSASMYAWDGAVDTVSTNSASWGAGGVDSATVSSIASSYAESAASSKMDTSAMTSYALSADVSGTVDLVSTQSANWGGSALALSAGPGVKLEKVGDTLVAGLDETVLWSGTTTNITGITLNETYGNFDRVRFYWKPWSDTVAWRVTEIPSFAMVFTLDAGWASNAGTGKALFVYSISSNGTAFSQIQGGYQNMTGGNTWASSTNCTVAKVVGVNRTAGV
jgi:hypothetical protein